MNKETELPSMTDQERARAIAPCWCAAVGHQVHISTCPARFRPDVVSALSAVREEERKRAASFFEKCADRRYLIGTIGHRNYIEDASAIRSSAEVAEERRKIADAALSSCPSGDNNG